MTTKKIFFKEKDLYELVKEELYRLFSGRVKQCYLEISAINGLSEKMKSAIPSVNNLVFFYLKKHKPDISGIIVVHYIKKFYVKSKTNKMYEHEEILPEGNFVIVEIKKGPINLDDINQLRNYALIFQSHYSFLLSTGIFPEELKRIAETTNLLEINFHDGLTVSKNTVHIGHIELDYTNSPIKCSFKNWYPKDPFQDIIPIINL